VRPGGGCLPPSHFHHERDIKATISEEPTITGHRIFWFLDLGHSSLQNHERYISIVYTLSGLRYFVTATHTTKDRNWYQEWGTAVTNSQNAEEALKLGGG
jgi:hypothetical protein